MYLIQHCIVIRVNEPVEWTTMDATLFQGSLAQHLYSLQCLVERLQFSNSKQFFFFFCGIEMLGALKMKMFLREIAH